MFSAVIAVEVCFFYLLKQLLMDPDCAEHLETDLVSSSGDLWTACGQSCCSSPFKSLMFHSGVLTFPKRTLLSLTLTYTHKIHYTIY